MNEFLYGFLTWFKAFFGNMLDGLLMIVRGIGLGIAKIFNMPYYFKLWADERANFGVFDWMFSILAFILTFAVWAGLIFLIVLGIRKYIRFRRTIVGNEDLLEEIADLHRDVLELTADKERILRLKVAQTGMTYEQIKQMFEGEFEEIKPEEPDAKPELVTRQPFCPPLRSGRKVHLLRGAHLRHLHESEGALRRFPQLCLQQPRAVL